MKTISSRGQYQDDQVACIIDSLIFGHLQRKQYSKTLHALLSESPHLTKDITTVPNAPNQIILNVNCFLHDQNLEQIIQTFYTYGRFDVSPNLLDLGKKLRDLTNEFSSELSFGCHSYSNNEQRLYGRKVRRRTHQNQPVDQMLFVNQLDASKRAEYNVQPVSQHVNDAAHNDATGLQYSQLMDSDGSRAEDHLENHHNRRKAVRPLKQSQRVMQFVGDVVKMSNEMRDKEAFIDNTSSFIEPFLDDNFDFLTSVADGETLFDTLESVEREEAMEREEADQNSRVSMNRSGGAASFALDIPMHYDLPPSSSSLISPLAHHPPSGSTQQSHSSYAMPPPPPPAHSNSEPSPMGRTIPRPSIQQYIEHPTMINTMESHNGSLIPFPPPPPPPPPAPHNPSNESQSKIVSTESENKSFKVDVSETSSTTNGPPSSSTPSKTRLPLPPPPPLTSFSSLPPSASNTLPTIPKLSSLGRIPKKGQPSGPSTIPPASPSSSPIASISVPVADASKSSDGFRMGKGKLPPANNGSTERRDSIDSQDTLRAESVGESDCTMTENEEEQPGVKMQRNKPEKKASWDDLFEDSPSTVEEANRDREKLKELENKRRLEMKEMEKRKERDKRRKDKDKKEDDRRDRSKDERNRYDKRTVDDRRRESSSRDERGDRDKEQRKKREQEEQKKVIESQKKQMEADERARQKKKEDENRKRELKEKEDEKRREKEKEIKKIEDEKLKEEKETKAREERRNELERRRRKEALLRKNNEKTPLLIGDSPLDKIAAVMDGKEMKTEFETTTRTSSRVMEISSGVERHRSTTHVGSLHSSKSGIFLGKAAEMRGDTAEKQSPTEIGRPIRPNRVQMAPMKRPPSAMVSDEESDDDEEETTQKKSKLEDNKIDHILNKIHR